MSDILASVSVVLGAEISGFRAAMAEARRELKGLVQFSEGLKDVGRNLTTYISAPIALLGTGAVAASAKLDSLKRGLEAIAQQELGKQGITGLVGVQQAAQQTGERLKVLQEIAKAPGLGLETAEQADIRLRAVGTSADLAAREIKAFANAIATTGGGRTEFQTVTTQLSQLTAKGKVLAQDLRPIIEAAPAVAAALQTLYGTVDSEDISKQLAKQGQSSKDFVAILTTELEKLPKVTGGLKAIYENDLDALLVASAKVGDGIAKAFNLEAVGQKLGDTLTAIGDGFANLSAPAQGAIVTFAGLVAATGPVLLGLGTLGAALPAIKAGFVAAQSGVSLLTGGLAGLLNPATLVVAGLAAAAAAVYYFATANERALNSYQQEAKQIDDTAGNVSALTARYNELSAKTVLTTAEQTELASVIKQLAEAVPGATTAIDTYGNTTAISGQAVTDFTKALQAKKTALAALNLPAAQAKLDALATSYRVLKEQQDEFNKTGSIRVATYDEGGGSVETYRAGSKAVLELQANLASANVEFLKQRAIVDGLKASTQALAETDESLAGALMSVGLAGGRTSGILADLREQLKKVREERENEVSEKDIFADNAAIKALEAEIARLEGTDKAGKKATDAVAKLRQELARLTALDNLLGDKPNELQVLERRSDALAKGLKTLVDAGVSPTSRAFQGFAADFVKTSQAADKLIASTGQLSGKTVSVKSLIPTTIGDTLPQDVARLLGDYAKKPIVLPLHLEIKPIVDGIQGSISDGLLDAAKGFDAKGLAAPLKQYGQDLQNISAISKAFGSNISAAFAGFDVGGAKVNAARAYLQDLRDKGFGPLSAPVQAAVADIRKYTIEAQNAQLFTEGLSNSFAALGGSIGDALVNGGDVLEAAGKALLKSLADIGAKYGSFLIALGIGDIASGFNAAKGVAEVAAGTGLVAASAALGAIGSGSSGSGSGGGSVNNARVSNYGQTSNQTTVKVIAEFRLRGQDLVASGRQKNYRQLVTG